MKSAAQACRNFLDAKPNRELDFPAVVMGSAAHRLACVLRFLLNERGLLEKGFDDFVSVFPDPGGVREVNVNFGLEVDPDRYRV